MARHRTSKTPPKAGIPLKPKHLSEQAALEWDRLVSEIQASGIQVVPAHRPLLALAATIAADIKRDWAEIQKEGAYHASEKGGVVAHPAVKRMDALRRDYIKTMSAIGLRPALPTDGGEHEQSLEDVLNGE